VLSSVAKKVWQKKSSKKHLQNGGEIDYRVLTEKTIVQIESEYYLTVFCYLRKQIQFFAKCNKNCFENGFGRLFFNFFLPSIFCLYAGIRTQNRDCSPLNLGASVKFFQRNLEEKFLMISIMAMTWDMSMNDVTDVWLCN